MDSIDPTSVKLWTKEYRLERLIGQGGMGAVYLLRISATERYVALKLIHPGSCATKSSSNVSSVKRGPPPPETSERSRCDAILVLRGPAKRTWPIC